MRAVPEALAARIESGAATLCHAWLVRRADEVRLGFTDHDRDLTVQGVVCAAASGWTAGAAETALGPAPGAAAAAGVLEDERLAGADVAAGVYDGAEVELWRVDWSRPELAVRLWRGRMGRIRREGQAFVVDLEGPLAALERTIGRTFARTCDATLGDGRCGVDLASAPRPVCDRRWETCVGVFGNGVNFRGFPDIPGDDWLAATPREGVRHDGGSRR
jgi:hypothetical protein